MLFLKIHAVAQAFLAICFIRLQIDGHVLHCVMGTQAS